MAKNHWTNLANLKQTLPFRIYSYLSQMPTFFFATSSIAIALNAPETKVYKALCLLWDEQIIDRKKTDNEYWRVS